MAETFNAADGRNVIAADTAESIGEVKGFVVDRTASRIESLHVAGRGRKAELLPWGSISSFGADAVMVDVSDATEQVSDEHDKLAVKGKIVARETRVLDTNGFEQGTVENVMFDPDSGELTGVLTTNGRVEGSRLRALGSYALIIEAA